MLASDEFAKAEFFRRKAATCGLFAHAATPADRELLLRMQRSWLDRARHEDLVDGLPPLPPAGAKALVASRHPASSQ